MLDLIVSRKPKNRTSNFRRELVFASARSLGLSRDARNLALIQAETRGIISAARYMVRVAMHTSKAGVR